MKTHREAYAEQVSAKARVAEAVKALGAEAKKQPEERREQCERFVQRLADPSLSPVDAAELLDRAGKDPFAQFGPAKAEKKGKGE